jgi:preprotein translocase subunit SecY
MFKTIANAWKIPDVRKKIIYTLMMLVVYRLGCYVPTPGVDISYVNSQITANGGFLGNMLNMFSGGALGNLTLFALGIVPYINASIIMNLLTIAIPALERMAKEGDEGRKKLASITRYAAVILGLVEAIGIVWSLGPKAALNQDFFTYVVIVLTLTAGTALIMWIGERITENGIGNGISLLIFISIVSRLGPEIQNMIGNLIKGAGGVTIWTPIFALLLAVVIVTGITFIDMGERRIPVQYAKRVVGRKVYGGQSTHLPMRINQSGVLPLIFAITLVMFPNYIARFWPNSPFYIWVNTYFTSGSAVYMILYALLIIFFTFFYTQISFNPVDVAKNMQQYGGFIPGIRPGKPTSDYLKKILNRITFFGAIFLAVLAAGTTMIRMGGMDLAFGATSLLIMVNVALETSKQLESQMMMRHYKGFLK